VAGANASEDITIVTNDAMGTSANTITVNAAALTSTDAQLNLNASSEADSKFVVTGGAGADSVSGGGAADSIAGAGGADTISGNAGNDTIIGGDGDDVIFGGAGKDTLTGDAGSDVFTYTAQTESFGATLDVITDFTTTVDKIDLSAFSGVDNSGAATSSGMSATDTLAFTSVVSDFGSAQLQCIAGDNTIQVVFDSSTNRVYADINDDGALNNNDLAITLTGVTTVVASDFVLA